jgi:hemolysin D
VPQDSHLEIEATLANDDIGFVHEGQEVEIKVHTFNFTRYGLLHGKVISVSSDAISRDGGEGRPRGQDGKEGDRAAAQDLVYVARISLDQRQMQAGDKVVDLGPGMAVTAEVKTGSRRIIGYLLSPIARYQHDVLRER